MLSKHNDPMSNFLRPLQHHTCKAGPAQKGSFPFLSVTPGDASGLGFSRGLARFRSFLWDWVEKGTFSQCWVTQLTLGWVVSRVNGPSGVWSLNSSEFKKNASEYKLVSAYICNIMLHGELSSTIVRYINFCTNVKHCLWFLNLNGISIINSLSSAKSLETFSNEVTRMDCPHLNSNVCSLSCRNWLSENTKTSVLLVFRYFKTLSKPLWQGPHPAAVIVRVFHQDIYWTVPSMKWLCIKRRNVIMRKWLDSEVTGSN